MNNSVTVIWFNPDTGDTIKVTASSKEAAKEHMRRINQTTYKILEEVNGNSHTESQTY